MKRFFTLFALLAMFSFAGCESLGDDNVVGGSYSINGAIQKGPFVQGSNITIQPLNKHLKPIGQMYTTQTTNDAGMFEMDGVNSKYAEIIATGYYFDEVEGKISASPLTLRSIADLKDDAQTNVNLLTSLTYNRIKNLVTNEGKDISEAQKQAEKELFTALGIPENLHPSVSCGAMNIANNGEGDGLLLALSAILQEGRTTGELSEYISKFATDLADDGAVAETLLEKFNLDGAHKYSFATKIKDHLEARYNSLGVEYSIPNYTQYLPYLGEANEYFTIPFTYKEGIIVDDPNGFIHEGIDSHFVFETDVEYIGHEYSGGYGEIYLSEAPTTIECQCFALRTIEIPQSVKSLCLLCCVNLESVTLPDEMTEIGERALDGCISLTNISIPSGVTRIGNYAFAECLGLTEIIIPDGVTEIGEGAFYNSSNITDINIPDGVTSIGDSTFYGCSSLMSITLPEGVTDIGFYAFYGCSCITNMEIPDNVSFIGHGAFVDCSSLEEFKGKFASDDGRCLIIDEVLHSFAPAGLTEYTIPESVTSIGWYAFAFCESMTSVTIPEGVTHIGMEAFVYSGLTEVTLPSTLATLRYGAFALCESLTHVYCKATTPPSVTCFTYDDGTVSWDGFAFNEKLNRIYVPEGSVEAYKSAEGWKDYADYIVGYDF